MSRFLKTLMNPSFDEEGDSSTTTEVDIDVKVTENEEATEGAINATQEVNDLVDEAEEGAATAEIVEEVKETVGEEGYSRAVARIVAKLGIIEAAEKQYGIVIAGHESLTSTGRNEEMAALVIKGCEAMLQDWWKHIQAFFDMLVQKIKNMWEWVQTKFRIQQKRAASMNKALKEIKETDFKSKPNLEGIASIADFNNNIKSSLALVEQAKQDLAKGAVDKPMDTSDPWANTLDTFGQGWSLGGMEACWKSLDSAFDVVYRAGDVQNEFKKLASAGVTAAKRASSGVAEAKVEAEKLREKGSAAAKKISAGLKTLNECAAMFIKVGQAYLAATKEVKEEKKEEPAKK